MFLLCLSPTVTTLKDCAFPLVEERLEPGGAAQGRKAQQAAQGGGGVFSRKEEGGEWEAQGRGGWTDVHGHECMLPKITGAVNHVLFMAVGGCDTIDTCEEQSWGLRTEEQGCWLTLDEP